MKTVSVRARIDNDTQRFMDGLIELKIFENESQIVRAGIGELKKKYPEGMNANA
jgi:Arc/MetJ-type ribon-helix-helix transcriptional regulator